MARARKIPGISPQGPIGEAAAQTVRVRAEELLAARDELLAGDERLDALAVHDARVAARRLQAALDLFEECFPKRRRRQARRALSELIDALGKRRDRDVQLDWLEREALPAAGDERASVEALMARLRVECEQADVALALALDGLDRRDLARRLRKLAERAERRGGEQTLRNGVRPAIERRLRRLCSLAPAALSGKDASALHKLRIAAKRLRYALEPTSFCFGSYASEAARRARELQDAIGAIHDLDVLVPKLEEHGGMGLLCARQRERRAELFAQVQERWAALERERAGERLTEALAAWPPEPADAA